MTMLEQINTIKRIDQLTRMKATGTPEQLSERLELSRSSIYRYINRLKNLGAPIDYCKIKQTFYYTDNFHLKL